MRRNNSKYGCIQPMRACIVGHGPSMCAHEYGPEIDAHDRVIRLKRSTNLLQRPELFGSRTDIVMGSVVVGAALKGEWSKRYWLFVDTRTSHMCDIELAGIQRQFFPEYSCLIDKDLCMKWISIYQGMRETPTLDSRQVKKATDIDGAVRPLSDDLGHLHFSAGMFAIIYAFEHLKPKELNLYGFDNVRTGAFDWSVTRGEDWKEYPDHNWQTEAKLIQVVAKEYGYTINHDAEVIRCNADT